MSNMEKVKYYWVYILLCKNGNYYTGYTNNLMRRYLQHLTGKGYCKYTRSFPPSKILQSWIIFENQGVAMKVERFIKSKSKKKKTSFIKNPELLRNIILNSFNPDCQIYTFDPATIYTFSSIPYK